MLQQLRNSIAAYLFADELAAVKKREDSVEQEVNNRVAEVLLHMDPFEPLLRKYNVVFSPEYSKPEDKLDDRSQLQLFMWAWAAETDPSFKYLADWIRNTQGNATVRKSSTDHQWFFGRAMVASISLFVEEVSRLSSRYKDILAERDGQGFDPHLPTE